MGSWVVDSASGCGDRTPWSGSAANAAIERDKRSPEKLSERDVAGVVDRQVQTKLPRPDGEELIRPALDRQVNQIGVGLRGLVRADQPCQLLAAEYVRGLEIDETGGG